MMSLQMSVTLPALLNVILWNSELVPSGKLKLIFKLKIKHMWISKSTWVTPGNCASREFSSCQSSRLFYYFSFFSWGRINPTPNPVLCVVLATPLLLHIPVARENWFWMFPISAPLNKASGPVGRPRSPLVMIQSLVMKRRAEIVPVCKMHSAALLQGMVKSSSPDCETPAPTL